MFVSSICGQLRKTNYCRWYCAEDDRVKSQITIKAVPIQQPTTSLQQEADFCCCVLYKKVKFAERIQLIQDHSISWPRHISSSPYNTEHLQNPLIVTIYHPNIVLALLLL